MVVAVGLLLVLSSSKNVIRTKSKDFSFQLRGSDERKTFIWFYVRPFGQCGLSFVTGEGTERLYVAVSLIKTSSFSRDEGAGVWGRIRATNQKSFFKKTVKTKKRCVKSWQRCVAASRRECGRGACKRVPEGLRVVLQVPLAARGLYILSSLCNSPALQPPATRRRAKLGQHPGWGLCIVGTISYTQRCCNARRTEGAAISKKRQIA